MQNKANSLKDDILTSFRTLTQEIIQGNYIHKDLWSSLLASKDINIKNILMEAVRTNENIISSYEEQAQLTTSNLDAYKKALVFFGFLHQCGYYFEENHIKAIAFYEKAMALGHPPAMNLRAKMYAEGKGGPVDYSKAITLYEQAIELGHPPAMVNRAFMYESGKGGGPVDYPKAITLYEQAIERGEPSAMSNRAMMYANGKGPVNYPKAVALYEQAIALGFIRAMLNLAAMYAKGKGVPVDYAKASDLYEQAAAAVGSAGAMAELASLHANGMVGPADYSKVIAYYEQAIALGDTAAKIYLNKIPTDQCNKDVAHSTLDLLWERLLNEKAVLSSFTLELFQRYACEEIVKKLVSTGYSVNMLFKIVNLPNHPIQRILGQHSEYREKLLQHITQVQNERAIFLALALSSTRLSSIDFSLLNNILDIAHGYKENSDNETDAYKQHTEKMLACADKDIVSRPFSIRNNNKTNLLFMPKRVETPPSNDNQNDKNSSNKHN